MRRATFLFELASKSQVLGWVCLFAIWSSLNNRELIAVQPHETAFRPPAVPLVLHDPYFSIWSPHDSLTDGDTIHWTEKPHRLTALVRINGKAYRLMGSNPQSLPVLPQTHLSVTATRTIYAFEHDLVRLKLSFVTPALPGDLDVLARPLTYLMFEVQAKDEASPSVELYLDADAEIAVNTRDQPVETEMVSNDKLKVLRVGTIEQAVLVKQGDDMRIDWGHLYLATEKREGVYASLDHRESLLNEFESTGKFTESSHRFRRATADASGSLAMAWELGRISKEPSIRVAMIAYDDLYSIRYFDANLRPYWRRNGMDAITLLETAAVERHELEAKCRDFDEALERDAKKIGDVEYAKLVALCHRQSLAGTKLVADAQGQPLFFTKENNSNGCLGTVDVFYPQAPHLLLLSPALMKATLVPILEYAKSPRWPFDFAPHDLGRYPHATGQVYGGGERTLDRQMMVEESANMLLLVAAVVKLDKSSNFALPYMDLFEKWAAYLAKYGYDPANQLCTDDFAGHLARNVNLSAKAICALGAYAQLLKACGQSAESQSYQALAQDMANRWSKDADDAGTHTRLGFGLPDTWSQKYNLAWEPVLGLDLFSNAVLAKEIAFYRQVNQDYGLPLDSRSKYTKLDWILWTATLARERDEFHMLVDPIVKFINATPDRAPLTDWYFTDSAQRRGFKARPVVGGVFMPMLKDAEIWSSWVKEGVNANGPWAPLPIRPYTVLASTGESNAAVWQVNWNRPTAENWNRIDFTPPVKYWSATEFPVGIESDAGTPIRSQWKSRELWARRIIQIDALPKGELCVRVTHSGPIEIWINGVLALRHQNGVRGYQVFQISKNAADAISVGENCLAIHTSCIQPKPQKRDMVDVGFIDREK